MFSLSDNSKSFLTVTNIFGLLGKIIIFSDLILFTISKISFILGFFLGPPIKICIELPTVSLNSFTIPSPSHIEIIEVFMF